MGLSNSTQVFLALVRAGLWEQDINLSPYRDSDFNLVFQLAQEQSVVGLVAAGIEHVTDLIIKKAECLKYAGYALQIEQRNTAMNLFTAELINKMRSESIHTLLLKGQGVAQCYERPLWRISGDIDFLLDKKNYYNAKGYLTSLATSVEKEDLYNLHLGMTINPWAVELHGTMRAYLWSKVDKEIDNIQKSLFRQKDFHVWNNNGIDVFLPSPDYNIIFVFVHILQHFYNDGVGLKQICDLCRVIWTYKDYINMPLLESRLLKMQLMNEWKAFAAFAVSKLGMPVEAMPLYSSSNKWNRKADKIMAAVLNTGSLGPNNNANYSQYPIFIRKTISLYRHTKDGLKHFSIFPLNSFRVWTTMFTRGLRAVTH